MYARLFGIIFLALIQFLPAQPEFQFPMTLKPDLSGAFGDLRKNHFHTGIDIRTGGVEGVPVYAAADGWIYRLKVSPYGFGNTIYLMHKDGYITAYAHLQKFIPVLEDSVLIRQKLTRLNSADWYLTPYAHKIKKGELIAWSGNSGSSGGPHLHFEIREDEEHILNPMQFYKTYFEDNYRPIPEKIVFSPISTGASIQGKLEKKEFTPIALGGGKYIIKDTIEINGLIGIEYQVTDRLRSEAFKLNVPFVKLKIDDSLVFEFTLNKFGFSNKRMVNKHLDYSKYQSVGASIQKCYLTDGNKFECYQTESNQGRIHLPENKTHSWKISFTDYHGNTSSVMGWIKNKPPTYSSNIPAISAIKPKVLIEQTDHHIRMIISNADKNILEGLRLIRTNGKADLIKPIAYIGQTAYFEIEINEPFPIQIKNDKGSISEKFNYKTLIYPDSIQTFLFENISLKFNPGVNSDTFALEVESEPYQWNTWSPIYKIGRKGHPLMRPLEIAIKPSRPILDSTKIFVAKCDGGIRTWLDGQKKLGDFYHANSIELGKFCLACDQAIPTAGGIQYKAGGSLSFTASDSGGSGLDEDRSAVFINGEWVPAIWQPKSGSFKIPPRFIPIGKKEIEIIVKDRVGNEFRKVATIY